MKIVIDISDQKYKWIVDNPQIYTDDLCEAIRNGTPRLKGKWLDKKTTIKGAHGLAYGRYGCSVCKRKFPAKSNFCPDCGADMRGNE